MVAVLRLHKVAKFYGRRCIFRDVSFELERPCVTLLTGANGAGKSTLLGIMAGLTSANAGTVECALPLADVGYLGHGTYVYGALTAEENLRFWANMYGLARHTRAANIRAALERVELLPFAEEMAGRFSRGMAQRLNLARILLLRPKLWLLDEPVTGLDTRSAGLLWEHIQEAKAEGAHIVCITHQLREHAALADRLLTLEGGRLVYDGAGAPRKSEAIQGEEA